MQGNAGHWWRIILAQPSQFFSLRFYRSYSKTSLNLWKKGLGDWALATFGVLIVDCNSLRLLSRPLSAVACWKPSGPRNGSRKSHHIAGLGVVGWLDGRCQAHRLMSPSFVLGSLGHWHHGLVSTGLILSQKTCQISPNHTRRSGLSTKHQKDSARPDACLRVYSYLSAKKNNATSKSIVPRPKASGWFKHRPGHLLKDRPQSSSSSSEWVPFICGSKPTFDVSRNASWMWLSIPSSHENGHRSQGSDLLGRAALQ